MNTTKASMLALPACAQSRFEMRMDSISGGMSRPVASHKRANSRFSSNSSSSCVKFGKFLMRTSRLPPPRPQIDVAAVEESKSSSSSSVISPQRGWCGIVCICLCGAAEPLAFGAARFECWLALRSSASTLASKMLRERSCPMLAARFSASCFSSRLAIHARVPDAARSNAPGGGGTSSAPVMASARPTAGKLLPWLCCTCTCWSTLMFRCNASASGAMSGLMGRFSAVGVRWCSSWCSSWCSIM
mmetsp:Transcript_34371/g.97641  ORF Transcript_34371/g.97641 Transcript_34371/m.97641 type:complete len:245 (+) Transcript_34371:801-1535(+)